MELGRESHKAGGSVAHRSAVVSYLCSRQWQGARWSPVGVSNDSCRFVVCLCAVCQSVSGIHPGVVSSCKMSLSFQKAHFALITQLALTHCIWPTHSHTRVLSHTHVLSHTLTHSLTRTYIHTHTHSLTHTHLHSHSHSLTLTLTLTLTRAFTLIFHPWQTRTHRWPRCYRWTAHWCR
jgi:hypothetical protein